MKPNLRNSIFIGGEFTKSIMGRRFEAINPSDEQPITLIEEASAKDVDQAVDAAKSALVGPWATFDGYKIQKCLTKLADLILQHKDELALIETIDTGKTLFESKQIEVPLSARVFQYYSGWANKIHGECINNQTSLQMTLCEPVGICGIITPWNFPLLMATYKMAPALALRNTIVIKPSEHACLSVLKLAELSLMAGFPPGVINVVPGLGEEAGKHLVNHSAVNLIAFTGSTETGKKIMSSGAKTLKRLVLELGGKSPNIIFKDADIENAIKGAINGIFYNKGEICTAGSRLLVQKSIYEEVITKLVDKAKKITVGDPQAPNTRMGPQISAAHLKKIISMVELGKSEGAELACGGKAITSIKSGKGFYFEPTIFRDVKNDMQIAQQEIFGPVLSVIPFESAKEALITANTSEYGLAAGVWTKNIKKALAMAQGLKAGTVWINAYNLYDPALPSGGTKGSGFGKDLGPDALNNYSVKKSVWVDLN
jgi:acyl-CoA reductase-like NAD-dependent aldehyde dehydrogenase